jgi:hypothetical protein
MCLRKWGAAQGVVASEEVKGDIRRSGLDKCARESKCDHKNFIRKLIRGMHIKRISFNGVVDGFRATNNISKTTILPGTDARIIA